MLFLPELSLLGAGLILFIFSLDNPSSGRMKTVASAFAAVTLVASLLCLKSEGNLFYSAYKVDFFSQIFKVLIALATFIILIFSDSRGDLKKRPSQNIISFYSCLYSDS